MNHSALNLPHVGYKVQPRAGSILSIKFDSHIINILINSPRKGKD